MSELVAAVGGGVVGALATYVFDLRKAIRERREAEQATAAERRRRRATIATAVLADLQTLEPLFFQLYNHGAPGSWKGERPRLFIDSLRGDVREFAASSVHAIAEFFRRADDLFGLLAQAQSIPASQMQKLHYELKAKAAFCAQAVEPARHALVAEGGQVPEPRALEVIDPPNLPKLPPRSFPDVSADPNIPLPPELG